MKFIPRVFGRFFSVFWIIAVFLLLLHLPLNGCAPVGPDYTAPKPTVSAKWQEPLKGGLVASEIDPNMLAAWWTTFNDAQLTSLVHRAAASNLDVKQAQARIREERARRGLAESPMFPTLNYSGSEKWTHSSENTGTGKTNKLYSSSFDSSWELDIFGGTRRSIEAAQGDLEASQENLHDVLVTLVSEVAVNYVEVRTLQARLEAVDKNLVSQQETYQLTQWGYEAGLTDALSVEQARYNLENTRSQIPSLHTSLEEAMNRIAVLLGEQPGKLHQELTAAKPIPDIPQTAAVGIPADMIRRRPDIRRAERELAAQTARIGVAAAELYPSFSLTGSIGVESLTSHKFIHNLGSRDGYSWNGGPGLSWALFQGGAVRQNIKVQTALQEQALDTYEAAILTALEEVENSLTAYADEQDRANTLRQAAEAAQNAALLAEYNYRAGLVDFSNVLDAQRSQLSFQEQLAQSNGAVVSNLVKLYKSLGGGWSSFALAYQTQKSNQEKQRGK
jgi:NodT family efflux transporter outer membrane factor (OMF) lipoprotein